MPIFRIVKGKFVMAGFTVVETRKIPLKTLVLQKYANKAHTHGILVGSFFHRPKSPQTRATKRKRYATRLTLQIESFAGNNAGRHKGKHSGSIPSSKHLHDDVLTRIALDVSRGQFCDGTLSLACPFFSISFDVARAVTSHLG